MEGRQKRKSRATRERLISASIEVIREKGFQQASAKEIANRAGITWGAVQHQFGTKKDILVTILTRAHQGFVSSLADPGLRKGDVQQRIQRFVDFMWSYYQQDLYLATLEIISALRDTDLENSLKPFADEHIAQLRTIFPEPEISTETLRQALLFAHFYLTGMAVERILNRGTNRIDATIYLDHCKRSVAGIILAESPDHDGDRKPSE